MKATPLFAALLLLAGAAAAQSPAEKALENQVESGELAGAPYRIEIPGAWNGELVVYSHGYDLPDGKPFPIDARFQKALRDGFVGRGFAFVQSVYAAEGWAVKEGVEDTEILRRHFVARHGQPKKTWITGHSMGGLIAALSLERYPEAYAGGIAFCPVLAPAAEFFESSLFDLLAAFDFLAGRNAGLPPLADPASPPVTPEALAAALAKSPAAAAILAARFGLRAEDVVSIPAFYQGIWQNLVGRAGGVPVDNSNTVYAGFGDDAAFNRGVRRIAGDAAAELYLERYGTPTGRLQDPLLVIHTTYDPIVPPAVASRYDQLATLAGNKERVRYRFVVADGHCNFSSEDTQKAFELLREWQTSGQPPAPGEL